MSTPSPRGPAQILILFCGTLSPAIYIATDIIAARRYPGFSYTDRAVSELFAIGAPTSGLVVAGFTVSSALLLAFAIGLWRLFAGNRRRRLLAALLIASAINGLVLWNAFPMHMRGATPSLTDTMHLVLAANPFWILSLIVAAPAFGNRFRAYSIATLIVLVGLAIYGFSFAPAVMANAPTPWMGLAERTAQYGDGLWQAILAVVVWRERRNADPNPEGAPMRKTDMQLQQDVIEELRFDPAVSTSEIGVAARNGVITLMGQVESYARKYAAVRAAERVAGVRALADEMVVNLPMAFKRTDTDLAHMVASALTWDVQIPDDTVRARVEEGWVWLEGEVEWRYQSAAAERAVRNLIGVRGVTNLLHVKQPTPADDERRVLAHV